MLMKFLHQYYLVWLIDENLRTILVFFWGLHDLLM
jgi:hypothetical protein